ncbi:MAG TPA: hypothetical protein VF214_01755, partial [Edaphobacter sp.]
KIDQFPRGTVFTLMLGLPRTKDQIALEDEAAGIFKRHGMTLQLPAEASGLNPNAAASPSR